MGCSVVSLAPLGKGLPDLAVGYGGLTILVEVKDGLLSPSKRKLTPDEARFHETWTGGVRIVKDEKDVGATVETLRRWSDVLMRELPRHVGYAEAYEQADIPGESLTGEAL